MASGSKAQAHCGQSSATPLRRPNALVDCGATDLQESARPSLPRAYTIMPAAKLTTISASQTSLAQPQLSRPLLTHAATTTIGSRNLSTSTAPKQARPGILRRITSTADALLDIINTAAKNAPSCPSDWSDHAHRATLLATWDRVHETSVDSGSKYPKSAFA